MAKASVNSSTQHSSISSQMVPVVQKKLTTSTPDPVPTTNPFQFKLKEFIPFLEPQLIFPNYHIQNWLKDTRLEVWDST